MTREGSHESRILHLLVQVADESLSSGMTGCHITDRLQLLFMSEFIKKYDLSVNLKMFENLAYVLIVPCEVELRNKPILHILVHSDDSLCLLIERYTNGTRLMMLGLACNVFYCTIDDICLHHCVKVTDTTTYHTLKHEDVTIDTHGVGTV